MFMFLVTEEIIISNVCKATHRIRVASLIQLSVCNHVCDVRRTLRFRVVVVVVDMNDLTFIYLTFKTTRGF